MCTTNADNVTEISGRGFLGLPQNGISIKTRTILELSEPSAIHHFMQSRDIESEESCVVPPDLKGSSNLKIQLASIQGRKKVIKLNRVKKFAQLQPFLSSKARKLQSVISSMQKHKLIIITNCMWGGGKENI